MSSSLTPSVRRQSQTLWRRPANNLEIYDYLLRHDAHVDIANATHHRAHYGKTWRHIQNRKCMPSEKDRATTQNNTYRKFSEVWTVFFERYSSRVDRHRHAYTETSRYRQAHRNTSHSCRGEIMIHVSPNLIRPPLRRSPIWSFLFVLFCVVLFAVFCANKLQHKAVVPCQNKIILKNFRPVGRPS